MFHFFRPAGLCLIDAGPEAGQIPMEIGTSSGPDLP